MEKVKTLFKLLVEGTRDKMFQKYADMLTAKGVEITAPQLKDLMRKKLTTEAGMNSMSLPSSYFLSGVTRLYFSGELTDNKRVSLLYPKMRITDRFNYEKCKKLNKIVIDLRNMFIDSEGVEWDVPEDFGDLSLDEIFSRYKKLLKGLDFSEKPENKIQTNIGNYTFEIIYEHKQLEKYGPYTTPGQWCITQSGNDHYFNYYTKQNNTHFVIFARNGWEKENREVGQTYPIDSYGTSLLAVQLRNNNGSYFGCTTRWNHGNYDSPHINNADFAVSFDEFKKITGCGETILENIQTEWVRVFPSFSKKSPKTKEELEMLRKFKYLAIQIKNGQNPLIPGHEMFSSLTNLYGEETNKWNKGIKRATITVNGEFDKWSAIMDNGVLKPNTLVHSSSLETLAYERYVFVTDTIKMTDDEVATFRRYVILYLDKYRSNKFKLYDRKKHSLVAINGKTVFDNTYGISNYKNMFIKVGTNQYSILNLETGETLKASTGTDVFELMLDTGSGFSERIKDKFGINGNKDIFLVGDSANKECFIYKGDKGEIIDFPTIKPGKQAVPVLSERIDEKSKFFIAANDPTPKIIYGSNGFTNEKNGTYIYSKEENSPIYPFGLHNPKQHYVSNGYETFSYLNDGDKVTREEKFIFYIKNPDKFFVLPDGIHLFYGVTKVSKEISGLYLNKATRYSYSNILRAIVRLSDGKMLTKNGFSSNSYDTVKYSREIDYDSGIIEFVFGTTESYGDGITKMYSPTYDSFMVFENGETECKSASYDYSDNYYKVETISGEILKYPSCEAFIKTLKPTSKLNEHFERFSNYKLKLL